MRKLSQAFAHAINEIEDNNNPSKNKYIPHIRFIPKNKKKYTLEKNNLHISEKTICSICKEKININNLGKIIVTPEETKFVCNKKQCMTISKIR